MLNSTSPSTTPALSSSSAPSCALNYVNHTSRPPIFASPSAHDLHAQNPPQCPHPALLFPFSHCHHFHTHPNIDSPHHPYPPPLASITASRSDTATRPSGIVSESFSSHSFSTDPHCYTTDCSPRSVIRHILSSSSGPSPDPGRPSSLSTQCIRNARTPRSKSHNLAATSSSIARPHHRASLGNNGVPLLHGQNKRIMMQNQGHWYPPWSSPSAVHHHQSLDASSRSLSASSERSYRMGSRMQNGSHTHQEGEDEGETYDQNTKVRRSPKGVHKEGTISVDLHKERQCQPGYPSGSIPVDEPCVNIESKEANERDAGCKQPTAMQTRLRSDTESDYGSNAHLYRYTRGPDALSDPLFNSMQLDCVDHKQRIPQNKSYSCDLLNVDGSSRTSSRQSNRAILQHGLAANASTNAVAPKSPDELLACINALDNHDFRPTAKGVCMQFGSKWEDAEKWLRPSNNNNHPHHPTSCQGLIPSFGLLRMSDCLNAGTAIKPHYINPLPVSAPSTADYTAAYSNCGLPTLANCMNHSLHVPFSAATNPHYACRSAVGQADIVVNHASLATRQIHHVDCFHPHVIGCNSNVTNTKQCSAAPHMVTKQGIVSRQNSALAPKLQVVEGIEKASQAQQLYQYDISGMCLLKSNASNELKLATEDNLRVLHCDEKSQTMEYSTMKADVPSLMRPLSHPGSVQPNITNQLTDRFARGECMPGTSTGLICAKTYDKSMLMGPGVQENVAMPIVSLREVGTQMSSIDGSGSLSRYTSKNGSPQKNLSPARHNTPAQIRSLNGSASNSGNVRRTAKQFINLEELVECHRAKLELQALSEGERIQSFHRTTSNWSSREVEEADLSRSLRHSTPELENLSTTSFSHEWPTQSYSWNKDDDAKLAKLQLKEAQIQAWENKKRSQADAKLKRLEENLAKKRSQTTTRIMKSLAAAQRKAENMRMTVYSQQRRPIKKGYRLRPRSLSPLSRCTCFSILQ